MGCTFIDKHFYGITKIFRINISIKFFSCHQLNFYCVITFFIVFNFDCFYCETRKTLIISNSLISAIKKPRSIKAGEAEKSFDCWNINRAKCGCRRFREWLYLHPKHSNKLIVQTCIKRGKAKLNLFNFVAFL